MHTPLKLSETNVEEFKCLIELLKYFVRSRRYGIVDRIATALSAESILQALYEAVRSIESARDRAIKATIKVETREGIKRYTVTCCDYGEGEGPGITGTFEESSEKGLIKKKGYCVPCPICIPEEVEINKFIEIVRSGVEGLSIAKKVAILAYTKKSEKET